MCKAQYGSEIGAALLLCAFASLPFATQAQTAPSEAAQKLAAKIQADVTALRGLEFKKPIIASKQTTEEFSKYLEARIQETVPSTIAQRYGKIVRRLGLYRGPEIQDFTSMMKSVMTSQAGAYYDPATQTFYVLMEGLPDLMLGTFYSHELHHGLQDQYFDLEKYLDSNSTDAGLDSDHRMARQAVVEGEASYIMNLWAVKQMTQNDPPRSVMQGMITMQSQLDLEQIRALMQQPQVADAVGDDLKKSFAAAEQIPGFILEGLLGAYFKGMNFVFAVQADGWAAVDSLYRDRPPQSTEQILHPEKWAARETPVRFKWRPSEKVVELKQWQLLDDDAIGELMWRVIFKEHGFTSAEADAVSAGWNGDRYAVFKRNNSDATLLLLRTSWDSKADADEFTAAYRKVLAVKYEGKTEPTRVVQDGNDVLIVEGGDTSALDALVRHVRSAERTRQ